MKWPNNIGFVIIECGEMITISIVYILYTKLYVISRFAMSAVTNTDGA